MLKNILLIIFGATAIFAFKVSSEKSSSEGEYKYSDFEKPEYCGTACHSEIYQQWKQSMMAQAFIHHWDEIEYFDLALPHSYLDVKMEEIRAGCQGCHSPLAFLAGDIPPKRPSENTRANEGVSCEVCHSIVGYTGDIPFNFNYIVKPGTTKFSSRVGDVESPNHKIVASDLHRSGDFCGICHNEMSPFGIWVKSTHLEWKDGPYYKEGVQCQDCHMPKAPGKTAIMGATYSDVRQHIFNGGNDSSKVRGTVEISIYPSQREVEPGETIQFSVVLFNQKTGHKFPTGSVEDRLLWLEVTAKDAKGNIYHLPVEPKGFEGEEYTISADILAYEDMGIPLKLKEFLGVQRDGIKPGNRIFRMPYFDPNGRITIQQWNTASLGVDYRFGPRETKVESFKYKVPFNTPSGKMEIRAVLNYQLLMTPVAEFLKVPKEKSRIMLVNSNSIQINILD